MVIENVRPSMIEPRGDLPKWICRYLNLSEVAAIESAVEDAEKQTSGEIVPIIVRRCVDLRWPRLVLSLIFVLLFFMLAEAYLPDLTDYRDILFFGLGVGLSAWIGQRLGQISLIRQVFIHGRDAEQLALLRAEVEFYRTGIGATKGNTGILLFLAIEERQAVVLADRAISSKLAPEIWNEVVALMINGLKDAKCADGMTSAILKCGAILGTHFPIEKDDTNELSNRLILKN